MIRLILKSLFAVVALLVVGCVVVASVMMLYRFACWPMDKYLLPAVGMAALCMAAGLVTVWTAGSGWHWFGRTVLVLAAISPALLIPGSDMVLVLSAQAVGIVVLLACGRCWRSWRAVRSGVGGEIGVDPIDWRARFRFTLADLLLFTTLLAVVLTVGTRVPRAVWVEWKWIVVVGLLAGVPVAVLFGRRKEAGKSTGRFYSWVMRPLLCCAWPLGVCTGVALVHFVAFPVSPLPMVVLPDPNGYDDLVQAGEYLSSGIMPEDIDEAMAAKLAELPDVQSRALALARRGLDRECLVPLTYTNTDVIGDESAMLREVGRAFQAEGRLAEMEGRHADAVTSYLDLLRMGEVSGRGGLLVDELVGWALAGLAISGLETLSDSVDVTECRRVIVALEAYDANRGPLESVAQRDRVWGEHALGKRYRFIYAMEEPWYSEMPMQDIEEALHRSQMPLRLVVAHMAIRQYRLEHETSPDDLEALVPDYLSAVPQDPYGNGPLVYRRTDTGFDLYSIGPDGVDDGGKPLERDSSTFDWLGDVRVLEPARHRPTVTVWSDGSDDEGER